MSAMSNVKVDSGAPVPNERRKVFFGLFVFPMLIAVTMAVLLSSIVLLTKEDETPESLITAIKTGAPSKRWQKAFELSSELNSRDGLIRSTGIMNEVIHILNDKDHYDARTRAYMAMALSRFQNDEAETALLNALRDADDSEDPKAALFIMWALGNISRVEPARREVAGEVARFLNSQHEDLRKGAAYVLGALGNPEATSALQDHLDDPVTDVRWNSALSLARLADDSGEEVLLEMLDRDQLVRAHRLKADELERVMVNAAKGLGLIQSQEAVPFLREVSDNDPSLKVRQAALAALTHINDTSLRGGPKGRRSNPQAEIASASLDALPRNDGFVG